MKKGKLSYRKVVMLPIIVFLILFSISALAQQETKEFNSFKAYQWLAGQPNSDVSAASWSVLAFNRGNRFSDAEEAITWILTQKNAENCFPLQACRTKDTSLALISMNLLNKADAQLVSDWLKGSLSSSTEAGNWLLEVATDATGTCKLSYESRGQVREEQVQVDKGKFPGCGNSNFYDLNTCLPNNALRNNPTLDLTVDCSGLTGQPIISLLYKAGNTFYIVSSTVSNSALVKVNNGCFGRVRNVACDKESTFYANWALKNSKSDVDTSMYLRAKYDKMSVEDNALMYLASKDPTLAAQIKSLQQPDGSWARSVQSTALALIVLNDDPLSYENEITKAKEWFATRQREDGSINSNAADTALALYSLGISGGTGLDSGTCSDGLKNQDERGIDCGGVCQTQSDCCDNSELDDTEEGTDCGGPCENTCSAEELVCDNDGTCNSASGESESNCPSDCKPLSTECVPNDNCEITYGENAENCPQDCSCGDGECDETESESSCSQDCGAAEVVQTNDDEEPIAKPAKKKSSSTGTFILILLLLGVLGAGGYFAYKRGLIKFPSGASKQEPASAKPDYRPFSSRLQPKPAAPARQQPSARPTMSKADAELEKSLEEAKKLLKK